MMIQRSIQTTQLDKAIKFKELHQKGSCFFIPNPWDCGTTKILTDLGFQALASTGAGLAFSKGLPDNGISREVLMEHLSEICKSTHLPVTADLESGFGDSPDTVAETIRIAYLTGIVGGSIEDSSKVSQSPIYDFQLSVERIKAAVEVKNSFEIPFSLTARAENYFVGIPDLSDTIKRLQAYEDAGADILFAPGIKTKDEITTILKETSKPLNILMGVQGMTMGFQELKDLGVTRISLGGSLARYAIASLYKAANELLSKGTATYNNEAISGKQLNELFTSECKID